MMDTLQFAEPQWLWLLLVPVFLFAVWIRQCAIRRTDALRLARARQVPVRERFPLFGDSLFWLCVIVSIALMTVALARPGVVVSLVRKGGVDLVILLDGSASMHVKDVTADRWQRSVRFLRVLGDSLRWENDRIALTLFARIAAPQVRLTSDPNTFFFFLDHLQEQSLQNRWLDNSWQPTEEINYILSTLIQDHTNILTRRNEQAIDLGQSLEPVRDTKLILLQGLWNRLFPKRKLEVGGFFPKVKRLDADGAAPPYQLRQMSDGERTVLYMAARIMTAEHPVILVDEPELHMHSRLAVQFWDEAEKLRPDCRFIYVTHDLSFALSRRRATILIARSSDKADALLVDELPSSVAAEVLGAATLPFYAKRIVFFEGKPGKGFASEFCSAWFDDDETFAIPTGDRDSVCAAVIGLRKVGVVAAEVVGLIDRDFYSDDVLKAITTGVRVLPLHEIESVLCDGKVVAALAEHLGKDPAEVWKSFLDRVRNEFRGQTLNSVVARRVRSRTGDLLGGAFGSGQVVADLAETSARHSATLSALDFPARITGMFTEESSRVADALAGGGKEMLAILPGKHLLSMLAGVLGLSNTSELTNLVVRSLNRRQLNKDDPLLALGAKIETALLEYLPSR